MEGELAEAREHRLALVRAGQRARGVARHEADVAQRAAEGVDVGEGGGRPRTQAAALLGECQEVVV